MLSPLQSFHRDNQVAGNSYYERYHTGESLASLPALYMLKCQFQNDILKCSLAQHSPDIIFIFFSKHSPDVTYSPSSHRQDHLLLKDENKQH